MQLFMPRIYLALIGTGLAIGFAVGCGHATEGPVCAPVKGSVTYRGKPLVEAMVVFHRLGGDVEGNHKPMATTDAGGNFTLTTFKQNDGAPPGEYQITVEQRALVTGGEEPTRSGPNVLPPKYAKPATSGFKFTVTEGENQAPALVVQ
jgi:hypothetical protein